MPFKKFLTGQIAVSAIFLCATPLFAVEAILMDRSLEDLRNMNVSSVGFFDMDANKAPG